MSFINVIQNLFGNKSTRDMKLIQPEVEKVKKAFESITLLSNDELRAKTKELQRYVQNSALKEKQEIEALKSNDRGYSYR